MPLHARSLARLFLVALALVAAPLVAASPLTYARVDVDGVGYARLEAIKATPGLAWWVEVEDQLLVLADAPALAALEREHRLERLSVAVQPERLSFVAGIHGYDLAALDVDVLAEGARHAVVQARSDAPLSLVHDDDPDVVGNEHVHGEVLAFVPGSILAQQAANLPPRAGVQGTDPEIEALVEEVDATRWFADVTTLAGWNRYTHGTQIHQARDWLVQQFDALPGVSATMSSFTVSSTTAWNVIATLPGTTRPDDWYIIGAHYDSRSQSSTTSQTAAPGAEDNASGCSAVLELARIFSAHPPEGTVLFLCFSGEEQGLFGSDDHVDDLVAAGDASKVQAVLNMDMMSYTSDSDLDSLLGSRSQHTALLNRFIDAAELYTDLRIVTSLTIGGSDHVPYLNAGIPAVVASSNDWSQYPGYHHTSDLPGSLSLDMARGILRMNVAAMAPLIGSHGTIEPDLPFDDGFESGSTAAWSLTVP